MTSHPTVKEYVYNSPRRNSRVYCHTKDAVLVFWNGEGKTFDAWVVRVIFSQDWFGNGSLNPIRRYRSFGHHI